MPGRKKRSHVFGATKRRAPKKSNTSPVVLSMSSLNSRLHSVPDPNITFASVTVPSASEVRARITSASLSVLQFEETVEGPAEEKLQSATDPLDGKLGACPPLSPSTASHASSDTSASVIERLNIHDQEQNPFETSLATMAQTKARKPNTDSRQTIGRNAPPLAPAFLPNHVENDWTPSNTNHWKEFEGPAYMRPSMSDWLQGPTKSGIRLPASKRTRNARAINSLGKSKMFESLFPSEDTNKLLTGMRLAQDASPMQEQAVRSLDNFFDVQTINDNNNILDGETQNRKSIEPIASYTESQSVGIIPPIPSGVGIGQYSEELLGASPQADGEDRVLWFERESFVPIDDSFSEYGEETCADKLVKTPSNESAISGNSGLGSLLDHSEFESDSENDELAFDMGEISGSDTSLSDDISLNATKRDCESSEDISTLSSDRSSDRSQSPSVASFSVASSIDFQLDNTFLGSTCARDLIERLRSDRDGRILDMEVARAWIHCVAADHANRCASDPSTAMPGITIISESDAQYMDVYEMQCRAKLGRVSLFEFLKMLDLDEEGTASYDDILVSYMNAAAKSQERMEMSKISLTGRFAGRRSM